MHMVDFVTKHRLIAALLVLAIGAAFAIDSLTPPGIGDGIAYAAVMMLCLWLPDRRAILATAVLCTALTIGAQFLAPPGGAGNFAWINRTFAVATIWIVAALLYRRDRIGRSLTAGGTVSQDAAAAPEFSTAAGRKPGMPVYAASQSPSRHALEVRRAILKLLPPMGGLLVAIVGASVLVGWRMNIPSLTAVLPGTVAMRPITAVGFVFSGAALFLLHFHARPARWGGYGSAAIAGLIGVSTMAGHLSGFDPGIDKWLFDWLTAPHGAAAQVWQMSLFAGSSFTLFIGTLLTLEAQTPWLRRISVVLGTFGLTLVSLAVIGYVYDMNSLYQFMGTQPTALHTAVSFFVLFASAALAAPDRGWMTMLTGDSVGKVMMRRLLLATVAVLLIVGFLVTNFGHYESISPNFGIAILALSTVILFSIVVWRSTTFLDQLDADRRSKDEALRASQIMLATAESVAGVGSWDWDILSNKLIWSEEHYRLFGFPPDPVYATNENWLACVHPEDRSRVQSATDTATLGHQPYDIDYRIILPDGTERIVNSKAEIFRDEAGQAVHMLGTVHDITERKRAEEALRESEDRLHQAVRISNIGIFDHDQRTGTIYWSPEQRKIYGWSADEIVTLEKFYRQVHPEDLQRVQAAVRRAHDPAVDIPYNIEHRILRRDGEVRWLTTRAHTFFEGKGVERRAVRTVGAALDITERKQAEDALRQSEVQLRQAQKMQAVGQLTGGIAHDFNNLLSVIVGNIELILDRTQNNPALNKLAQAALDGSLRGAELTQRLLAFSRNQSLQPKVINLGARLPEISALLHPALGEQINIVIDAAADLWPVCVDPSQIGDSILNLALNARDAMPKGGTLAIEATNVQLDDDSALDLASGDYVQLTVSDNGTGMPPEVLERAFEPFFTTKAVGKGSGLGLSMVYGFVKQSQGHIKIYSEAGHGTTVNIYLPRADATSTVEVAPSAAVVDLSANNELILVVEDNEEVRNVVMKQLVDLGYRALEAETGEAALDLIDKHTDIDLVLSDVVMRGGMDGYELARQARKRRAGLRILLMSGFTMKSAADRFADSEDFELLKKPYRKHDLALKLRQLLTPHGAVA
jgi:PAS domain S-box-containing protein